MDFAHQNKENRDNGDTLCNGKGLHVCLEKLIMYNTFIDRYVVIFPLKFKASMSRPKSLNFYSILRVGCPWVLIYSSVIVNKCDVATETDMSGHSLCTCEALTVKVEIQQKFKHRINIINIQTVQAWQRETAMNKSTCEGNCTTGSLDSDVINKTGWHVPWTENTILSFERIRCFVCFCIVFPFCSPVCYNEFPCTVPAFFFVPSLTHKNSPNAAFHLPASLPFHDSWF